MQLTALLVTVVNSLSGMFSCVAGMFLILQGSIVLAEWPSDETSGRPARSYSSSSFQASSDTSPRTGQPSGVVRAAVKPNSEAPLVTPMPKQQPVAEADLEQRLLKRLEAVEAEIKELNDREKAAKKAKLNKPTFDLGGRIHLDWWNFMENEPGIGFLENPSPSSPDFGNDPEDRIVFRRIRLEFAGDIPQNMLWRMQIDFNRPSNPEYKDVYLGWENLPGNHSVLVGNQKRPLGLDHLNSSRFNVFAERPLIVESFNEDARRIGACLYGHTDDESANWRLGIFNLENTSQSGRFIGDSLQMGGYGRFVATPWYDETSDGRGFFHWAVAGAVAKPDGDALAGDTNLNEARFRTRPLARSDQRWINTGRIDGASWYEIIALEGILNLGRLQLTSEYMANFVQRDNVTPGTGSDVFLHGFYVYASYFLTGESMGYNRRSGTLARLKPYENFFLVERLQGGTGSGWGAWQIAARYDFVDFSDEDIRGGVGNNVTLGLNWHWNAYSKVQNNLVYGDITDRAVPGDFDGGDYWIFGSRWMCDF